MKQKLLSSSFLLSNLAILSYLALFKFLAQWLTSSAYGYFRDELYYLAASQRLALGYVDYPLFIAWLTAFVRATLGESLPALRFFPALAGAFVVLLTGLMARELGGRRFAQVLAAVAALLAPIFLAQNSMLTMDSFDELWWVLGIFIVLKILKHEQPRGWLWFGLVAGLGLLTKVTIAYLGAALVVSLLLTPARKYLFSKWLWLGGVIAGAETLPGVRLDVPAAVWPLCLSTSQELFSGSGLSGLLCGRRGDAGTPGPSAALEFFGRGRLPRVISGHNSYHLWGPQDCDGRVMIIVGGERAEIAAFFAEVEPAAFTRCRYCMPYENKRPIFVARHPQVILTQVWPQLKHFD